MTSVAAPREAELDALLARHRAFWSRAPVERPLLDVIRSRAAPELRSARLTPAILSAGAYADGVRNASRTGALLQGDFLRAVGPFGRVPWMEAIAGCPILVEDVEVGGMWPRPRPFEWFQTPDLIPTPDNPWFAKLLEYVQELVAGADGSYLVTHALMRGPIDVASALLGDVRLGLAFHDHPAELGRLLGVCAEAMVQVGLAQLELVPPFRGGYASFYGIWAPGPSLRSQADSASQVSARTYREHVLPHDRRVFAAFEYSLIDLHSGGTLHLADELVEVPELKAISITIDPYESAPRLRRLVPAFARILERKPLILFGAMKRAELDLLLGSLPAAGLAIRARLDD